MPIYEYRCSSCGFQKEFLQKLSDPILKVCPECSKETFSKMLTAAGFQLKGSGWYATDFRNSGAKPAAKADAKTPASAGGNEQSSTTAADAKDKTGATASGGKDSPKSDAPSGGKSESKTESKSAAVSGGADVRP